MNFPRVLQPKRKLAGIGYTGESGLLSVDYAGESVLTGVATQRTPQQIFLTKTHRHRLHWGVLPHRCRLNRQVQTPRSSLHR
jgi:hypothetical protein